VHLSEALRRRPRLADLLALLAGVALVGAFAPLELRALAVLAPAVILLLWFGASPREALRLGYVFGLGLFGAGVSWIYNSLHFFGAAVAPLAALITLGFVMFLALYPALLGWLLARFAPRSPEGFLLLAAPAAWVLAEWVRGWLLTGFPWLYLGHAQIDTPLGGIAPVFGTLGASGLTVFSAGLLAYLIIARGPGRRLALAGLIAVWVGAGLLRLIPWSEPVGEPLRVALVQGSIPQGQKWEGSKFQYTLDLYRDLTLEHLDHDLIVWPESAVPTFAFEVYDDYLRPLDEQLRASDTSLLLGIFTYDSPSRSIYNSVMSWGGPVGTYRKRHLVPFGEYLPLRGLLGWLAPFIDIPMSDISPGEGRPVLAAAGLPVGVSICYEGAYGEEVVDALPEARLLVNVSNDAWFGRYQAPQQHLEIARMRALETGRYLLRATNTGISAVIDPKGRLLATAPQSESEPHVLSAEIEPRAGLTPYALWENWAVVVLAVLLLAGSSWRARRVLRSQSDSEPRSR
jgi:apolipoprotein N-acyltransferase